MPNPRLAGRYAKSLVDLSQEKGQLETIYKDMQYLKALNAQSKDFVQLMRSPVIQPARKEAVIEKIIKANVSVMTMLFVKLLVTKGREGDLPEIVNAFIDQYNTIKGIHRVTFTTAVKVSDELKKQIEAKVKSEQVMGEVELDTKVDESLIGGFVLEFNNNVVDASISRELRDVRKQFSGNVYVRNIR
jgi:F-type H+-transporting ATPase subunit delta